MTNDAIKTLTLMLKHRNHSYLGEIISQGTLCYLGSQRIKKFIINELLRLIAIKEISDEDKSKLPLRRYEISPVGVALVQRPEIESEIRLALAVGRSFTIENNRVVNL